MTGWVLVPVVPHKSQGDLKPEVLSLHDVLLIKMKNTTPSRLKKKRVEPLKPNSENSI